MENFIFCAVIVIAFQKLFKKKSTVRDTKKLQESDRLTSLNKRSPDARRANSHWKLVDWFSYNAILH